MPELPEVETVRRGLAPIMEGAVFETVTLNRPDLRFPFDPDFIARVQGQRLLRLTRRAKFLQAELSSGERLFMHLGMSGRFIIEHASTAHFVHEHKADPKHHHVVFGMENGAVITFNDPRRFGFMELAAKNASYRLDHIGVCEALFRTGVSPRRAAGRLKVAETDALALNIKDVLSEAIEAGGSSLRDFSNTDGKLGYFQHRFDVYGREGQPCPSCDAPIQRIAQSGRSSFFCRICQN